jgi:hypothetical protein
MPNPIATRADSTLRPEQSGNARHRWFVAAVLTAMLAVRILLVSRGGQHFFYDEAKFGTSTGAAELLLKGDIKRALVFAIEPQINTYADHIGFKLIGIAPELIQIPLGGDDRVAAYFFSVFSVLSVLLMAAIAGRLGGSRRAFDLTLVAGALSATLLEYARFLVPYDLSLCVALLALWIGLKRPAGYLRSTSVGALAAWSFFCYYGYWQLAGIVVLLHALWLADSALGFAKRLLAAGLGSAIIVLALFGISELGRGTLFRDMVEITKYQSVGQADFRSGLNSWLYLFYAEKAALFLWIAPFAAALWFGLRSAPREGRKILTPLTLMAFGFLAIYAIFILDSDLRHNLVVHGRHSRQLAPFLIIGFGLGLDQICKRSRHGTPIAVAAAVALGANALATFSVPLSQEFPVDFKKRAEAVIKAQPPITDGRSYYRLVNVDHFIYEPEILRSAPMETLLASPHPLEYAPYLYEGESREMKALRRSIDHRMRLVRMAVPEDERIRGEPYGMVTLTLEFPGGRAGYSEPILSIGPRGDGDLFFVKYLTVSTAELGFEDMNQTVVRSAPFDYEPGKARVLALFSGSLMPADDRPIAGEDASAVAVLRQRIYATIDGRVLFEEPMLRHSAEPGEVYAGVNTVEADSAGAQFYGRILGANRGGMPPPSKAPAGPLEYGSVRLRISAPATGDGSAEPLVVAGLPGRAVLGYMRVYPDGSTRFGIEIWGIGTFESNPMSLNAGEPAEVDFAFGSLFPGVGLPGWNGLSNERQRELKRTLRIVVNGNVALEMEKDTPDLSGLPVYYGRNPVGGSTVDIAFQGQVLSAVRDAIGN